MFTGIVEEIGMIRSVPSQAAGGSMEIRAAHVLEGTKIGDSIAVNGVCLTVTALRADGFLADVMPETLRRTNLGALKCGDPVDLERAMAADGRFGGHMVSGHIDGTGSIREIKNEGNAVWVTIKAPEQILELIVEKGSVAIDGISLTVAKVTQTDFSVSVIPHTGEQTVLLKKRPGDTVNLENDMVGKYVRRLLGSQMRQDKSRGQGNTTAGRGEENPARGESGISMEFLQQHGFF